MPRTRKRWFWLPFAFLASLLMIQAGGLAFFNLVKAQLRVREVGRALFPEPRLQIDESQSLKHYQAKEKLLLESSAWIDHENRRVRIPIERAMELLIRRQAPSDRNTESGP